jgi:hypothetical protein
VRDDFEAEVRAMLARRAADLTPTAAGPPRESDLRAAAPPASHPWTAPSRRRLMAAAAALLLAGVANYAVARDTSPPVHTSVGTPPGPAPIIWPLNPVTPTGPLAEPGDAAAAYLAESVDIDGRESAQQPTLWPPVVEGDEATVHYSATWPATSRCGAMATGGASPPRRPTRCGSTPPNPSRGASTS